MIFTAVLVLSSIQLINAQVSLGLKAGLAHSDVSADLYIDAVSSAPQGYTSGLWGITAEVPLHTNVSVMTEVLSTRKGFVVEESTSFGVLGIDIPVGGRVTTSIHYVETPLLLKANIGSPTIQGYGVLGTSVGYATAATLRPTATLLIDFNLPEVDINLSNSMYNRWNAAAVVGAGGQATVGPGKIFADVRYQHGLTDMVNSTVELDLRNTGFQITAGYAYTF